MPNFNSPAFLKAAIKYGLLSPNANAMDCYALHGILLRDSLLLTPRPKFGLKFDKILASLKPEELVALRERVNNVRPIKS